MTYMSVKNTIRGRFQELIADKYNLPTQYDNHDFNKPEDGSMWCRLTIKDGDTNQISIGSPSAVRERTIGIVMAQIFIPSGQGDKQSGEMAELIKAIFKRITINGVKFRTPSIIDKGEVNNEWQKNVNCPFQYDSIN